MPQMIYFIDKIAFWRGTKRFTDGERNTVESQTDSQRVARKLATDGRSDPTSRVVNTTNQSTNTGSSTIPIKTGDR